MYSEKWTSFSIVTNTIDTHSIQWLIHSELTIETLINNVK